MSYQSIGVEAVIMLTDFDRTIISCLDTRTPWCGDYDRYMLRKLNSVHALSYERT